MIKRFAEKGLPLFVSGGLCPVIGKIFSLSEAGDAHRYMEAGGGFGKTVLTLEE
jgi:NADPH2:quinone reductase